MKSAGVIAFILFLGAEASFGQYQWSFSGYVMDVPSVQVIRPEVASLFGAEREQTVNVGRIRLRPDLVLWTDAKLAIEYEISSLYHSSRTIFGLPVADERRQVVSLSWTPVDEKNMTVRHFIDRFHLDQTLGDWDFILGRQRISWGTGRVWNPTDLFNPLNPTSYAKIEKDGVDAALLRYHAGSFSDMTLVVNPERHWGKANVGVRLRTNYHEFDFAVVGGIFDSRKIVGIDFAGNLSTAGVRGEGIVSAPSGDVESTWARFILGIDYQFSPTLYALAEYHFNGEGASERKQYDLARLASGEIINVGRNYLALQGTYLVHPLVNALLSYIHNLDDRSTYVALSVSCSATDELTIAAGGQLFFGEERSEYWWYPRSLYLRGDWYF